MPGKGVVRRERIEELRLVQNVSEERLNLLTSRYVRVHTLFPNYGKD
jgi:hypothetical protein